MRHFTVRPLEYYPYINILQVGLRGENPIQYHVSPQLASPAKQAKFAPDMNQMALSYDLRVEEMPIFGNPNLPVPQLGIRVFSGDDRYLLLGGSAGEEPVLYRRTGPTYMRFNQALQIPTAPAYITHAAFTSDGTRLALVSSDDQSKVLVYQRDELDNLNPIATVNTPAGTLEAVEFSPADGFLIVKTATAHAIYDNAGASFPPVAGLPAGRLLTVSAGDQFFVVDTGNQADNLKALEWTGTSFISFGDIPSTQGTERKATFNPVADTLVVSLITPANDRLGPLSFFRHPEDGFSLASLDGAAWPVNSSPVVRFSRDSSMMYGFAGLYGKQEDAFYPHSSLAAAPGTAPAETRLQVRQGFSPDGLQFAYVGTNGNILHISSWDGTQFAPLQTITYGTQSGYCFSWSPDGMYLAIHVNGYNTTFREVVQIWKWNAVAQQYEKIPFPYLEISGSTGTIRWSRDGNYLLISDRVYIRSGDNFTFGYNGVNISNPNLNAISLTADNRIIYTEILNKRIRIGRYTPTQFEELADVPNPSWLPVEQSYYSVGLAISSDDARLVVTFTGSLATSRTYAIYAYDGSSYSLIASDDPSNPALVGYGQCAFSPDGQWVYVTTGGATGYPTYELKVFRYEDHGLQRVWVQTRATSNRSSVPPALTPDGATIIYAGWLYRAGVPYTAHSYRFISGPSVQVDQINNGFSPEGDIVHVTQPGGTSGVHRLTSNMAVALQTLPFEDDYQAADVYDVLYSPQGTFALWKNPLGLSMAVKRNDNSYIKLSKLNGTFVGVYWLDDNRKTFFEKGYAMHAEDATISNMVFSQTPIAFSYFSLNGEENPASTQGRHIYNTFGDTTLALKGNEFEPNMLASYLAFSPFEVYFAATYRRPDGLSDIVLYKFIDGSLNYEAVDTRTVSFGPLDFSSCNHIVVAHGGFEHPFTIFEVDTETDTLVEKPYPPMDWQHEGIILDIAFVDCERMVVVTPEEIVIVDRDPETGEIEERDSVERDDEAGEDIDIVVIPPEGEDGEHTIILEPLEPGEGDDGYYGVGPDHITPLTYIPYTAISIFYRE